MEFNGRPPPSEKTDLAEGVEVRRPNQDGFLLSNIAALPFVLSLFLLRLIGTVRAGIASLATGDGAEQGQGTRLEV